VHNLAHVITAMAFSRDKWVDRTAKILSDAVGEYAKQRLSAVQYDRGSEMRSLIKKAEEMFDPKKVKTKTTRLFAFDLREAFLEAIRLAALFRCAINMLDASTDQSRALKVEDLLIVAMIKEYSPVMAGNLDV